MLDEALFTAPAHPQWGGAALIGADGKLAGIGSLLVQEKIDAGTIQGNMIVPIDLLAPILERLLDRPRKSAGRRVPGSACTPPTRARASSSPGSRRAAPAERAGVRVGDAVIEVGGEKPCSLADLWRRSGRSAHRRDRPAQDSRAAARCSEVRLTSADRADFLKKPHLH